jgi:hypothetical protein
MNGTRTYQNQTVGTEIQHYRHYIPHTLEGYNKFYPKVQQIQQKSIIFGKHIIRKQSTYYYKTLNVKPKTSNKIIASFYKESKKGLHKSCALRHPEKHSMNLNVFNWSL